MITINITSESELLSISYRGKNPVYNSIDLFENIQVTGSELMDALALLWETRKEMEEDNGK